MTEHRLPAGTKLAESALCETFGASRSHIRLVWLMLAEREIVNLQSNRGAFVASPSPDGIAELRDHVKREREAVKRAIRLSNRFHVTLAEMAQTLVLCRFIEDLVARTSLIIGLFGSSRASCCSRDEQAALIETIAERDDRHGPDGAASRTH